jgi:hypothetical protein
MEMAGFGPRPLPIAAVDASLPIRGGDQTAEKLDKLNIGINYSNLNDLDRATR